MNSFLSGIEGSGWLRHVKAIMETAFFVANAIHMGISVVIHCSDGWDRTSQTCCKLITCQHFHFTSPSNHMTSISHCVAHS